MISLTQTENLAELMQWREEVIINVFGVAPDTTLLDANISYYSHHIADRSHIAFVAECDGEKCGCGGICFTDELPSPDNPTGRCAYLMNIYVREPFRHKGIAHNIVRHLLSEAKNRGCGKIYLETTAEGKPVYSSLGFMDMPDMMKYYDNDN